MELYKWVHVNQREYFMEYIIFVDTESCFGFTYSGKFDVKCFWTSESIKRDTNWSEVSLETI